MMLRIGMRNNRAFSLLEVLVVAAIVATCLAIILGAFSITLRIAGISSDYLTVNSFMGNKLEELQLESAAAELIDGESALDLGEKFEGTLEIETESESQLSLVKIDVNWPKGSRSIGTYILNEKTE